MPLSLTDQIEYLHERNARLIVALRRSVAIIHRLQHDPHTSFFECKSETCKNICNVIEKNVQALTLVDSQGSYRER